MLKTALAAALIAGAASSSAYAKATQYIFETAGGGAYCDGLLLTKKGNIFTGTHNSPQNNCTEGDYAGGFYAKGFGAAALGSYGTVKPSTEIATITTEDQPNGGTNFLIVFNLDIKDKVWAVFVPADGGSPVNGGPLGTGADAQNHPQLSRPAFKK